jgi:hypothetical protein
MALGGGKVESKIKYDIAIGGLIGADFARAAAD